MIDGILFSRISLAAVRRIDRRDCKGRAGKLVEGLEG